jgi:hypothetical protein
MHGGDKAGQRLDGHEVGERPGPLVHRVEHKPGKARGLRCIYEFKVDAFVGQQHADEAHLGQIGLGKAVQSSLRAHAGR